MGILGNERAGERTKFCTKVVVPEGRDKAGVNGEEERGAGSGGLG